MMFEKMMQKSIPEDPEGERLLSSDRQDEEFASNESNRRKTCCDILSNQIDIAMIPSKLCFFFYDSAHVIYFLYKVVFFTSIGLSVEEASIILGFSLLMALFCGPIWGYLADCTGRSDIIFLILLLGASSCAFPCPWIADALPISSPAFINSTVGPHIISKPFTSPLFYTMLFLTSLVNSFMNPVQAFVVSFVMSIIKSSKEEREYGWQNVFGAYGTGVTNLIAGFAVQHYSSPTLSQYTPIFYIHLSLCLLSIPCGLIMASQAKAGKESNDEVSKQEPNRLQILRSVYDFKNIVFMITVILSGICNSTIGSFLFQLMNDEMQGSKLAMGLSVMVASIGEVIMFYLAKIVLKFLGGPINGMMASIFSFFIRFLALSFIKNDWLVLPTQILHGFSFAIFFVSATEYTHDIAHEEIYATLFNIIISFYCNIGGIFGSFVAGLCYHHFGGRTLFFGIACISGSWVVFMYIYFHIYLMRLKGTKK